MYHHPHVNGAVRGRLCITKINAQFTGCGLRANPAHQCVCIHTKEPRCTAERQTARQGAISHAGASHCTVQRHEIPTVRKPTCDKGSSGENPAHWNPGSWFKRSLTGANAALPIHSGLTASTKPTTFSLRTVVEVVQKKPVQSKVLDFRPQEMDAVERQAGTLPVVPHRLIAETSRCDHSHNWP